MVSVSKKLLADGLDERALAHSRRPADADA